MRHHPSKEKPRSELMLRKRTKTSRSVPSTRSTESLELRDSFPEFKYEFIVPNGPASEVTLDSLNERLTALERKFETSQFAEGISKLAELLNSTSVSKQATSSEGNKAKNVVSTTSVQSMTESIILKKKKRCRFFPNCREGSRCAYFHPNKRCTKFPHCSFGANCLFLHPYCPHGIQCLRVDCPYTHYIPLSSSEASDSDDTKNSLEVVQEEDEEEDASALGPTGRKKTNDNRRKAAHPKSDSFSVYRKDLYPSYSSSSSESEDAVSSDGSSTSSNQKPRGPKFKKQCRYGIRCLSKKCPFQHKSHL